MDVATAGVVDRSRVRGAWGNGSRGRVEGVSHGEHPHR